MLKRILMNAADQGGGGTGQPAGGVAPPAAPAPGAAAPVAPAQPQAQGAALGPDVIKTIADQVVAAVTPAVRDSIFADARRAGLMGNKSKPPDGGGSPAPAQPAAVDLTRLRSLDRTLGRTGLASSLSEQQYARLERDYIAESPDDVEGWVKAYFPGSVGSPATPQAPASPASAPAATPAAPQIPTPQPANTLPVTDRGSPPVPRAPLEEQSLLTMTPGDREALRQRVGNAKFTELLNKQLRDGNVRFSLKG